MSEENVELITRMYRAWNNGDMEALIDVFDAEVEVRPALPRGGQGLPRTR